MKLIQDLGTIYPTKNSKTKRRYGLYECPDCFKHFKVATGNVRSVRSTRCGSCSTIKLKTRHGLSGHKLHETWTNMKRRCYDKSNKRYDIYGGEGVTVCREWKNDFKSFYDWAINAGWNRNKRIEKDILCEYFKVNPKIYSPSICMWVSQETNSQATKKISKQNKSGYRGVSKKEGTDKWTVQISVSMQKIHIGYSTDKEEAAKMYDEYIKKHNLKHTRNFDDTN